jgi:undecaprenyl-diphosphatase
VKIGVRRAVDYHVARWLNHLMHHHPLAGAVVVDFANWGVVLFGVLAVGLWTLSAPYGDDVYKRACACGLSAAAVGLLTNQLIIALWHRPRPYEAHTTIVPLLARSHDASFPSDHASAAFGIAFAVLFVARRAGLFFLLYAVLIGASRVLAGMHYPSDVLAGAGIGLLAAYLTTRLYRPLLAPAVRLVSRLTDPLLSTAVRLPGVSMLVLRPSVRATLVAAVGVALLVRVGLGLRHHLFDEMDLLTLAALAAVVVLGTVLAMRRYWPFTSAIETRPRL